MLDIEKIKAKSIPIMIKYGVNRAYLFGSYSRHEQTTDSDIDIIVEYGSDVVPTLFTNANMKYELENVLHRKVDILTMDALSPYIRPYVQLDKKLLYERCEDSV